jgi:hypothetical protein
MAAGSAVIYAVGIVPPDPHTAPFVSVLWSAKARTLIKIPVQEETITRIFITGAGMGQVTVEALMTEM